MAGAGRDEIEITRAPEQMNQLDLVTPDRTLSVELLHADSMGFQHRNHALQLRAEQISSLGHGDFVSLVGRGYSGVVVFPSTPGKSTCE